MATRTQRRTKSPHGTITRYNAGCSCFVCCDARNRYMAEYKADPDPRWVDVTPVREHLHRLYAAGYSRGSVAAASGVPYGTLRIIDGTSKAAQGYDRRLAFTTRVRRANAEAILAVDVALPGRYRGLIPAGPTRTLMRRLHKKMEASAIARGCGLSKTAVLDIMAPASSPRRVDRVRATTALAVVEFAERSGALRRGGGEAEHVLDSEAFERLIEARGYDRYAIIEAAGITVDTYLQLRTGRACSFDMAERLAIAAASDVTTLFSRAA